LQNILNFAMKGVKPGTMEVSLRRKNCQRVVSPHVTGPKLLNDRKIIIHRMSSHIIAPQ